MTDLHARLTAEIEHRLNITTDAAAAETTWPFRPYGPGAVRLAPRERCIQHAALHDPADALRRYTHYQRILERHPRLYYCNNPDCKGFCATCADGDDCPGACQEIRDLADALNIPHTQDQP